MKKAKKHRKGKPESQQSSATTASLHTPEHLLSTVDALLDRLKRGVTWVVVTLIVLLISRGKLLAINLEPEQQSLAGCLLGGGCLLLAGDVLRRLAACAKPLDAERFREFYSKLSLHTWHANPFLSDSMRMGSWLIPAGQPIYTLYLGALLLLPVFIAERNGYEIPVLSCQAICGAFYMRERVGIAQSLIEKVNEHEVDQPDQLNGWVRLVWYIVPPLVIIAIICLTLDLDGAPNENNPAGKVTPNSLPKTSPLLQLD